MKKFYGLTKEELKSKEKEFEKTAFGKRLSEFKNAMLIEEIVFVIVMLINSWDSMGDIYLIQDSFFWLGLLIAAGLGSLIQIQYLKFLKEYIEETSK